MADPFGSFRKFLEDFKRGYGDLVARHRQFFSPYGSPCFSCESQWSPMSDCPGIHSGSAECISGRPVRPSTSRMVPIITTIFLLYWTYKRGKDVNFDQLNSHAALAFDFLNGHTYRDLPYGAGFGTGLPALWAVPWWIAASRIPDWQTGLLLVGWAVPIIYCIRTTIRVLFRNFNSLVVIEAFGLICGLSSVSFLTELGTTFGNLPSGMFMLFSITMLFKELFAVESNSRFGALIAGSLAGISVGLKWTNAVYLIASVVALLIFPKGRSIAARYVGVAGVVGGFISLPWVIPAWKNYGSPLYPWYNNIFRSKFFAPIPIRDGRWGLSSLDLLSFPWSLGNGTKSTGEVMAADCRLLLLGFGIVLSAGLVAVRGPRRELVARIRRSVGTNQPLLFLTTLTMVSYVLWGSMFGVQRYFLIGEILVGIVALGFWSKVLGVVFSEKLTVVRLAIVPLFLVSSVNVPNFGHLPWSGKTWYTVDAPGLDQKSIDAVLFENTRIAYLSFIFRPEASRIGLSAVENPGYRLERRVRRRIGQSKHLVAVFLSEKAVMNTSLSRLNLRLVTPCGVIRTGIEPVNWCRVERAS